MEANTLDMLPGGHVIGWSKSRWMGAPMASRMQFFCCGLFYMEPNFYVKGLVVPVVSSMVCVPERV